MTHQEILEKAIQKAIDGGWITMSHKYQLRGNGVYWKGEATEIRQTYPDIIFNHDFAKALWGKDMACQWCGAIDSVKGTKHDAYCDCPGYCDAWEYHLQQMVILDDPLKYLGENL